MDKLPVMKPKVKASFALLDRDDGVLIPGEVPAEGFTQIEVAFQEGLSWENIEDDDALMLQSQTGGDVMFLRMDPDAFNDEFDEWMQKGWFPVGFGMVRYYSTVQEYLATLEE